ncbi:hypothetical protein [Bosea vaviloviae]|uniref:hypothetical protein n=1 Tax=Bosea vaviloviae TaxID=1526658 RepID=UPI0011DFB7DF|nr:hypothetical protein [Bosea vaviloviae]
MTQVISVRGGFERRSGAKSNPRDGLVGGIAQRKMERAIGIEPTTFSLGSGTKTLNVLARVHRRIGLQDRRVAIRLEIAVSSVDGRSPIIYPKLKRSAMPSETLRNGPSGLFSG